MDSHQVIGAFPVLSRCSRIIVFLLAFYLLVLPQAHADEYLTCGGPVVEFEDLNPQWMVTDDAGTGTQWESLSACGLADNYTGGTGEAYCVVPTGVLYDTSLVTEEFTLESVTAASLSFRISYDDQVAALWDKVDVDIKVDNGPWVTLVTYDSDQGVPMVSGSSKLVNLNPYVGDEDIKIRWRYSTPVAFAGQYVQIDDVQIGCAGGADLQVSVNADKTTVVEGEEITFTYDFTNNGPEKALDVIAVGAVPPGFLAIGVPQISQGFVIDGGGIGGYAFVGPVTSGTTVQMTVPARSALVPEVTLEVSSPPVIAGNAPAKGALFGPVIDPVSPISGKLVLANDGTGTVDDGCEPLTNTNEMSGNIALLMPPFDCSNDEQVKNAENAGAIAAIVTETPLPPGLDGILAILVGIEIGDVMTPSGNVTSPINIPSLQVASGTGTALQAQVANSPMVSLLGLAVLSQERSALALGITDSADPDFSFYNENTNNVASGSVIVLKDSDRDGVSDIDDGCPQDGSKSAPGVCGCGSVEVDLNANGVIDCVTTGELKDLVSRAAAVLKKLKKVKRSANRQKSKNKKKQQKELKDEFKALLDEIVSTVQSPVQPIVTVNANVILPDLAELARKQGQRATRTNSKKFKKNKAKARRALNDLQEALA